MRPAYAVYLLEVQWVWDHANTAVATITVEGVEGERYDTEFERLTDPSLPPGQKEMMLAELRRVAAALNRSTMGEGRLVRLYRVEDYDGVIRIPPRPQDFQRGQSAELRLQLMPICSFDTEGNPVAVIGQ